MEFITDVSNLGRWVIAGERPGSLSQSGVRRAPANRQLFPERFRLTSMDWISSCHESASRRGANR
ncbi:hypothetical protein pdam_00009887 [Pocillopora damicornis]|uniref:Uncharacterized protein n=1 Tax=Pocillopora damicornis TaxID=46731 RepID=A0A3M6TGW3_POCDA|nr:hypothetical protein pdam_00009887 [Pocillopora damicornis]